MCSLVKRSNICGRGLIRGCYKLQDCIHPAASFINIWFLLWLSMSCIFGKCSHMPCSWQYIGFVWKSTCYCICSPKVIHQLACPPTRKNLINWLVPGDAHIQIYSNSPTRAANNAYNQPYRQVVFAALILPQERRRLYGIVRDHKRRLLTYISLNQHWDKAMDW